MRETLVWRDGYPDSNQFVDDRTSVYPVLSRYEDAASLLRESSLEFERVEPSPATPDDLRRCCSERRLRRLLGSPPTISPDRPELWAEALAVGGTLEATDAALSGSPAVHLGGGFHHAHRGGSSTATLFNDVVAAVEYARERDGIDGIAIVDLDVHHPDGTRAVYRLDGAVSLFSMHAWNQFPGTGWIHETGRGDAAGNHLNAPVAAGTGGRTYLAVLERLLPPWLSHVDPDLVIYVAGADVHAADPIGTLELTVRDVYERDRYVAERVEDRPFVVVLGGGYGDDAATIHANTAAAAFGADPIREPGTDRATYVDEGARSRTFRWFSSLVEHFERHHPDAI